MHDLTEDWQQALANAVTDPQELCRELTLDQQQFAALIEQSMPFNLRVPRSFVARMQKGHLDDPLLLQILPLKKELEIKPGFGHDPILEQNVNPIPGLLHKYQGRVLLVATGACAVHCRYCFRRDFPYEKNVLGTPGLQKVLDYISFDKSIEEVILSGGDPLIIKDNVLSNFLKSLSAIKHVKILRIHSRLPIVLPERITSNLLTILNSTRLQSVMIIHCNHPQEINDHVSYVLKTIRSAGITLMNQSVLLRGINDKKEILIELSHRLFSAGVLPYYLHLLDPVQGAAHFAVSVDEGKQLLKQIRDQLPGYLVPKLVQEIAGEKAKVNL